MPDIAASSLDYTIYSFSTSVLPTGIIIALHWYWLLSSDPKVRAKSPVSAGDDSIPLLANKDHLFETNILTDLQTTSHL